MSFSRVDELAALIGELNRCRSPRRAAALASSLVTLLQPMCDAAVMRRNAAMVRLRESGHSLETIGQITGLTRARVHQIVQRRRPDADGE